MISDCLCSLGRSSSYLPSQGHAMCAVVGIDSQHLTSYSTRITYHAINDLGGLSYRARLESHVSHALHQLCCRDIAILECVKVQPLHGYRSLGYRVRRFQDGIGSTRRRSAIGSHCDCGSMVPMKPMAFDAKFFFSARLIYLGSRVFGSFETLRALLVEPLRERQSGFFAFCASSSPRAFSTSHFTFL